MVARYEERHAAVWDAMVDGSSNGTFLSGRAFLSYHPAERFEDHSLLVLRPGAAEPEAVIPAASLAHAQARSLVSHPGATYGGIVLGRRRDLATCEEVLEAFIAYVREAGFDRVVLRQPPLPFHAAPCESVDFLLQRRGFAVERLELSSLVDLASHPTTASLWNGFDQKTRNQCRLGDRMGLRFGVADDYAAFHALLADTLTRHGVRPVHTPDEMRMIAQRCRDAVRLYGVWRDGRLVAGAWAFRYGRRVFHTQYLAASAGDRDAAPMNFLVARLLESAHAEGFRWFSFGVSTEEGGTVVNRGLFKFKEGFGASGVALRTYAASVDALTGGEC